MDNELGRDLSMSCAHALSKTNWFINTQVIVSCDTYWLLSKDLSRDKHWLFLKI